MRIFRYFALLLAFTLYHTAHASAVDELLSQYQQQGAGQFSASAGAAFWQQDFNGKRCTQCHASSPQQMGQHSQTHKSIQPMAPSVNPQRLTDSAKIEKWFARNCKFTLGRECSAQEKGNVLVWLRGQ